MAWDLAELFNAFLVRITAWSSSTQRCSSQERAYSPAAVGLSVAGSLRCRVFSKGSACFTQSWSIRHTLEKSKLITTRHPIAETTNTVAPPAGDVTVCMYGQIDLYLTAPGKSGHS
eukprot:CAMPEP_0204501794 /NCGR_PEP_ID=MMETSP0471-20130131/99941_1 /ASSEMBLY_ACC=CAM_ASM_000602 /TAXON_ID=2969 /ORGANISM="Oxyrrhis marina" /LENGTH=115 /DNA_ID=CAMNT_0051506495 /DNA_START=119 /DNA_END=463 /DNA_ORIENTATION=+